MYHPQTMSLKYFPILRTIYFTTPYNVKRTAVRTSVTTAERAMPACVLQCLQVVVMAFHVRFNLR